MNRDDAYRICPGLLIIEGSDLERYRIHARAIYESFRRNCQLLVPNCAAICKGSMDEMMAETRYPTGDDGAPESIGETNMAEMHVYDEHGSGDTIVLKEDQSGASSVVAFGTSSTTATRSTQRSGTVHPERSDRTTTTRQRLLHTAAMALKIRRAILDETGFTTTLGVSCSPLLAKLASGLQKPGTVNVLVDDDRAGGCRQLVESMPLRKIPGIGHGTMKALLPCLEECHGARTAGGESWKCRDLLQVPHTNVRRCLDRMKTSEKSRYETSSRCCVLP
jgi:nucleotidyltransferase/DNA polymerase involved in DNA repair